MTICAAGGAQLQKRIIAQTTGHIFNGAADRVAAVKGALRSAKHLNPFNIIDIKNRRLRTIEINIVDINADPGFKSRYRILLSDAANKGGER